MERPLNGWVYRDVDGSPLYLGDEAIVVGECLSGKPKLIVGGRVRVETGYKKEGEKLKAALGLAGEGIEASQLTSGGLTMDGRALYIQNPKDTIASIRYVQPRTCAKCESNAGADDYLCRECREAMTLEGQR